MSLIEFGAVFTKDVRDTILPVCVDCRIFWYRRFGPVSVYIYCISGTDYEVQFGPGMEPRKGIPRHASGLMKETQVGDMRL